MVFHSPTATMAAATVAAIPNTPAPNAAVAHPAAPPAIATASSRSSRPRADASTLRDEGLEGFLVDFFGK